MGKGKRVHLVEETAYAIIGFSATEQAGEPWTDSQIHKAGAQSPSHCSYLPWGHRRLPPFPGIQLPRVVELRELPTVGQLTLTPFPEKARAAA